MERRAKQRLVVKPPKQDAHIVARVPEYAWLRCILSVTDSRFGRTLGGTSA
jgi:hypothetical protein